MVPRPQFLFATCQVGAEPALKRELSGVWPGTRLAFSRPGFLTFKLSDDAARSSAERLSLVFARSHGLSIGQARSADEASRAQEVWRLVGQLPCEFECLHVWQRDMVAVGHRGFEPHATPAARQADAALRGSAPTRFDFLRSAGPIASPGSLVLDVILVDDDVWWVGYHRPQAIEGCWPGGIPPIEPPGDAVSRAYLKMEEALLWSGLPVRAGQWFAEIGCSPGGASQALLARGLRVLGIDPADVDPRVLANPRFRHVRKRGLDVRRREFRDVTWLAADMNVAPQTTLETVEAIVTHPAVDIRGLLLTLKLLDWSMAQQIPEYLDRVRSWGYRHVRARQLAHNRQEICVMARRRPPRGSSKRRL